MFENLETIVGDNSQAMEALSGVKEQFNSTVERLQTQEQKIAEYDGKMNEIIQSRDKVKNTVRETLGINEISRDAILDKIKGMGDSEIKRAYEDQLSSFKKENGSKVDELTNQLNTYESEIKNLKMSNNIAKTEVMGQVKGERAADILLSELSKGAEFAEDGSVIYIGSAGERILNKANGEPMTLEDKIVELKQDPSYSFLFESRFLSGGGAPTTTQSFQGGGSPAGNPLTGGKLTRTTMTHDEKKAYREKYGEAAYTKLPMI